MRKIILLLIIVTLLQSCIKLDSKIQISEDGKAKLSTNADVSKLNETQKTLSGTSTPKNFCDEYDKEKNQGVNNSSKCVRIDQDHSIITDEEDLKDTKGVFNYSSGIYVIDLKPLYIDDNKNNSSTGSEENQIKEIALMISMGFQYNMDYELPGKIIKSDIGSFSGNHLYVDLEKDYLSLKKKNVYVIVKKDNLNMTDEEVIKTLDDRQNKEDKTKLKEKYYKQLILIKSKLKSQNKLKYANQIDKLLSKLSKDKQQQIFDKIQKLKNKNDIINYLEAKIYTNL